MLYLLHHATEEKCFLIFIEIFKALCYCIESQVKLLCVPFVKYASTKTCFYLNLNLTATD